MKKPDLVARKHPRSSLRAKMIFVIVALVSISTAVISTLEFRESRAILRNRILSDLSLFVDAKQHLITNLLEADVDNTLVNASRRLPRGYLVKLDNQAPDVDAARVEAFSTLHDAKKANASIRFIDVMDKDGRVRISTEPERLGRDLSGDPLFARGRQGVSIGDLYIQDGAYVLDIAVPQFDPFDEGKKEAIGVFRVSYNEDKLIRSLNDEKAAHSTGELVLAKRSGDNVEFVSPLRYYSSARGPLSIPWNSKNTQVMKEALTRHGSGIRIAPDYRGEMVLSAYDYIPMTGWGIVAKVDVEEAFFPIRQLREKIIFVGLAMLFLSSLAVFVIASSFARPIKKLSQMADLIANGDLNARVKVRSSDEIGQLAASLNHMAENLWKVTASRDDLNTEIEKRRKAENELKKAYGELQAAHVQLVQVSKMAAVGQLAGGVAHEINNPLTGVLNNVQLLKMSIAPGKACDALEVKELLDVIEESAARCSKIVRSLLEFSHASKGKFQDLQVNTLVARVVTIIEKEVSLDNISLEKDLQDGLPDICADAQLLQQVIMGLVVNARWAIQKKSGAADGVIVVRTWWEAGKNAVGLSVSDNGIGILPEHMPRLFEPFFTTKDVGEGTGLGLALAYNIIKNHNGSIEAESRVGAGTVFKIFLPAKTS